MDQHPQAPALLRGRVVTPSRVIDDGVLVLDEAMLAWVGEASVVPGPWRATLASTPSAPDVTLLPGLVDLHNHGGGGQSFPDAQSVDEARIAVAEHLAHGTTSLVASLVTADVAVLLERTALLAGLADTQEVVGIHLEGPFLSRRRCGAQSPDWMLPGRTDVVRMVAEAARGHLAMMTVAPEVDGICGPGEVIDVLAELGAVASIGHTDASAEVTEAAIARASRALSAHGSRSRRPTATHLFNSMRPMHHRDPGPVGACLAAAARGELVVELVADGTHLAQATVREVFDLLDPLAIVLVTDAMAAAGMPDGSYELGPTHVRVRGGVARLVDGDQIAGGTAHLLDVVRTVVAAGVPLVAAVHSAATTPATVLGRADLGALEAGRRADVLVTGPGLAPLRVIRSGRVVVERW